MQTTLACTLIHRPKSLLLDEPTTGVAPVSRTAVRLDEVRIGQTVYVRVDAYPERRFRGHVVRIGQEALFTPTGVLTYEEQVKRVFPVVVRLDEGLDVLTPGMPADVRFGSWP